MGTRTGAGRAGNGVRLNTPVPGPVPAVSTDGARFEDREYSTEVVFSGSDPESDSGEEEDGAGPGGDRRGVKRRRSDREVGPQGTSGGLVGAYGGVPGAKPGKKTRGRVKIKMEFIDNKLRRYTTFSKRKTGIMKKAYELSTLTGTQVLLLVASETGHVYTFATRKLQPMITSETGKALIQTCLNSPDSPPRSDPSTDQRMSATGFEETDLTYQVSEADGGCDITKDMMKPAFTMANVPAATTPPIAATTSSSSSSCTSSVTMQTTTSSWQPTSAVSSTNGTVLKTSTGVVLPGGFTLMSGASLPPGTHTIPLSQLQGGPLAIQGTMGPGSSATVHASPTQPTTLLRLPATISLSASLPTSVVSSASVSGHMMYPSGHTVMYATPTSSLGDGSIAVLNTFPPTGHAPPHDSGSVSQVFLTSLPPVTTQIPVSAVQLHPMLISQQGNSTNNLTELQVVSLDVHQSKDD
ncbi:serum response factor-like isoform X3 [Thalassophryne amazonica]|uniref:serum response factor-like isoform X3 n=1 Tax=Thalassophryne amazonica TaxID=390379 RepID=UPI001471A393|nr:serum response factor-like isoform X3 [Thalassophryne amazonica]